jgi:hypothetical protein
MAEEGLTAELLAKKFANGGSMERYMGKWLLLSMESQDTDRDAEDQFAELRQIPVIRSLFGSEKINMAEILKSWYPVGRNSVNKRLQSEQGLRVGEVVVFKASRPECLGRKSKYIAFGTRPLVSVKLMYPIATDFSSTPLTSCSSSSATSGSSSSSPPSAPSASTSTTAASNCSKMQKLGAEPPPPENQKRTSRPSLSSSTYLMFNDDVDDEAAEAAIAECTGAVGGKRRMTRSTAETKIDGEVAWERARDKETGQFYSWEDHASELQSQVHGLVKLLEATGLKLGKARAELSMSDKHLSRREKQIGRMETKHVEDSAKVRAAEHSKAEASCLKLKRLHESVSKQLLTTELALAKQKGMTVAAEAAATDAKSNAKRAKTDAAQALRREAKTRALLEKAEGMVTAGKAEAEKMRKERNKAWAERRGLKESVTKYQSTIASRDKKVAYLERQRGAAEREMGTLAMEVEDVLEDLDDATRLLVAARGKMSELEQRELDLLVAQVNEEEGMLETGASVSLIDALGKKKGERWSQDIIELGMELMEKNLSGQQAESVTRAFVHFQHPHLTENADYRIPSAARFKGTAHCFGFQFLYTKKRIQFPF